MIGSPVAESQPRPLVWVWSRDLFYASRLPKAADAGIEVRVGANLPADLEPTPAVILLDLDALGLPLEASVAQIRLTYPRCRLVAFGSHVHAERLRQARLAGCDEVVTRGQLHQAAKSMLEQWCRLTDG